MGNCFAGDVHGARQAVGGEAASDHGGGSKGAATNDAAGLFLKSRGLNTLSCQIESDPMAVVYAKRRDGTLEKIGHTEVILDSLNPIWIAKFVVNYQFEVVQPMVFQVYDIDSQFHNMPVEMLKLDEQQFLGHASCYLSEIVTKSTRSFTLKLDHGEHRSTHLHKLGELTLHAEECVNSKVAAEMIFRCTDLENKDLFSKSDPFLVLSKFTESGVSIPIFKTEVGKNDLNPIWKPLIVNLQQVGSKENPLNIDCYNFNNSGSMT